MKKHEEEQKVQDQPKDEVQAPETPVVDEQSYQTILEAKVQEYISTAQHLQADFDNYRKKTTEQLRLARQDGLIDAVRTIIPAIDSFNEAKKVITDEKILSGVLLVENKIITALQTLGIEKIESVGKEFDPNFHNALATKTDNSLDNDIVTDEYQAGYKINDKIIRYSQVIVNKKEEK